MTRTKGKVSAGGYLADAWTKDHVRQRGARALLARTGPAPGWSRRPRSGGRSQLAQQDLLPRRDVGTGAEPGLAPGSGPLPSSPTWTPSCPPTAAPALHRPSARPARPPGWA